MANSDAGRRGDSSRNDPHLNLAEAFLDRRLPPADVLGTLADFQIRGAELEMIAELVQRDWPDVQAIRCTIRHGRPFFSTHIFNFSEQAQRHHWPLADRIEEIIQSEECRFLFLPTIERKVDPGELEVFSRHRDNLKYAA
ncbi:MAG: hypothetical protein HON53_20555 [Planctomycetaceae bacterium]|nr:hypothetical protein [Planctomycetaceae bacterium]MBT6154413.1 hypothetical protein [Planctomycetaceae bacterium]MBT6484056.1 hypothetical protein [Planctomycetaceae bacterium]MBT6496855.1 hypothetical protein [Planctomycetaceae bacterium]